MWRNIFDLIHDRLCEPLNEIRIEIVVCNVLHAAVKKSFSYYRHELLLIAGKGGVCDGFGIAPLFSV